MTKERQSEQGIYMSDEFAVVPLNSGHTLDAWV